MIVAVFSGLSFVATTSSDEKYARSFLKPMIERIKHILIIRDIYLGLITLPKNEVLVPLEEEKTTEKSLTRCKRATQGVAASESTGSSSVG